MRRESGISLTGLYICGAIAFIMLVLKLSIINTWSWWRVLLPLGLIVGFTVTNIMVAFIYLSFAQIPDRPDGDDAEVLEPHTINVHYVVAMLFFIVFGDNVVRWIEGSETSHWFWLRVIQRTILAMMLTVKTWYAGQVGHRSRTMETAQEIKQTAHLLIDSLPDDATWETLLYALQVRHDIEAGLADAKANRVYSTAEARARLGVDNA